MNIEQFTALRNRCSAEFRAKIETICQGVSLTEKYVNNAFVEAFIQGFETAWVEMEKIRQPVRNGIGSDAFESTLTEVKKGA